MDAKSRLDALTGLRFVACLAVAVTHLAGCIPGLAPEAVLPYMRHAGSAAVPLFFALSGFVLGYSYRERLRNPTRAKVRDYLVARAARVYPVHVLVVGLCLAFPYSPLSGLTVSGLVAQLLLVHVWDPMLAVTASVNGVTWTLGVEVFLYLCLPGMLWYAGRRPADPGRYLWLAGVLIAVQAGLVLAAGRGPSMWTMWVLVLFPVGRLFEFGAGVLLGLAFEGLKDRGWADPPATVAGRIGATLLELAAGVLVFGAVLAGVWWSAHLPVGGPYTLAAAAMILVLALGRGWVSRVLSVRPLRFLGETSYALYIVHCLVIFHLCRNVAELGLAGLSPLGLAAVVLLAVVAVSAVLHVAFERPVRDLIVGLMRKPAHTTRRPGSLSRIAHRLRLRVRAGNVG
jgi:peptidoglycan/LPS O-acetylase OafA/YrhL